MSPITHGLISWILADQILSPIEARTGAVLGRQKDRLAVSLAGVLPDLDGAGIFVDGYYRFNGNSSTDFYTAGHHVVLHGFLGCLLISAIAWGVSYSRSSLIFLLAFMTAHIHLFCDLLGSRGIGESEYWPIVYGGPWSHWGEITWPGQWRLDSWQNVAITTACILWCLHRAWKSDRSPLELVSRRAHRTLHQTLADRFGQPTQPNTPTGIQLDRGSKRRAENEQP